jgi:N-formylglutamate amidohydrolase
VASVEEALGERGLVVRRNDRYPGGWTVQRFAGHARVDAIQVELNQRRYLDLAARVRPAPPPRGDFDATQALLRAALGDVAGAVA